MGAEDLKEKGNEAFNNGDWDGAIDFYTRAIKLSQDNDVNLAILYKNRAAAYLKKDRFESALNDCDKSLELKQNDPKALFRKAQALEGLERFEEAYRDARQVLNVDPKNKAVQPLLERLFKIVQERARTNAQISTKVESMFKIAFDLQTGEDKRESAINNLLVLAREKVGAELLIKQGVLQKIKTLLKVEKNREIFLSAIRIVGELCRNSVERTKLVLKDVGLPWFLEIIDSTDTNQVNAAQYCMQTVLNSFSGMTNKEDSKPDKDLCEQNKFQIDTLLSCLVYSLTNPTISGSGRDAIIELLAKNIHYTSLNWAERLVEIGGVEKLMQCASELEEYKYESAINITPSTSTIAAVCLSRIYDNMYYDQAKETFLGKIEGFVREKLLTPDIESKVRVAAAITSLLRGPMDVGNTVIAKEGVMEMILTMANTEDVLQQKVACECIIAAASKADKAKAIISQGMNILKNLYRSKEDAVRVRALVGLCKLGSSGGNDASLRPFPEGSTLKLAEACRRFLLHPGKSNDLRKWAAEGLSYLTLDAEVKEKLVEDKAALAALIDLAKSGDQSVIFGVVTTLVNLVNAYEKQEVLPEMVELAKFAKQHIPQEHELDDPDFVTKRIVTLGKEGVTSALVALSKTESMNSRELIARVFNALCSEHEIRGLVVQQGGVKVLMDLAKRGTDKGKRHAAQAMARIGITINPETAYPGQRTLEVIRPLIYLLRQDFTALENFEALMALCNIAQVDETSRQRILKEGGLSKIEHYMFEEHQMLLRAATQVMTNLCMSPDVVKIYEGENDKVKYLVVLAADEDLETCLAASGALAILTDSSEKCCKKVFDCSSWLETFHYMLANKNANVQYRGVSVVLHMIQSGKEVAEKVIDTDIMEILMALTKVEDVRLKDVKRVAESALKSAEKLGIIKKPEGASEESSSSPSTSRS